MHVITFPGGFETGEPMLIYIVLGRTVVRDYRTPDNAVVRDLYSANQY